MWNVLKFCLIAIIILGIAWWVASLPGDLTANGAGYQLVMPVPVAILLLGVLVVLTIILTRLLVRLKNGSTQLANWHNNRRRAAGEIALQRGLVAVAAGDARSAEAAASKARSLLGDTPFVQWLTAEAARLAGRTESARLAFEHLTESQEMKFLGHQGLLRVDLEAGRWEDANNRVEAAEAAWPGGNWTRKQRINLALRQQDYPRALQFSQLAPERAALAAAAAQQAKTPALALNYAKQALKADASQPVVIATLAQALRRSGKDKAARKTILKGWAHNPHPLLAEAWVSPDSSPLARAQDAVMLAAANEGHMESELLLAQTALDADLQGEARRHAEAAKAAGNHDGRAEAILAKLNNQPPPTYAAPGWHCSSCQNRQDNWTPVCPACGQVGTLR